MVNKGVNNNKLNNPFYLVLAATQRPVDTNLLNFLLNKFKGGVLHLHKEVHNKESIHVKEIHLKKYIFP